jgi:hypothetical protein
VNIGKWALTINVEEFFQTLDYDIEFVVLKHKFTTALTRYQQQVEKPGTAIGL